MPRSRDFRLLLAARTISVLGSRMALVAIPFAVLELGGSATQVGLVVAAEAVPQVLLLLFGGVIADRLPRQGVMVGAEGVAAVAQGIAAVLMLSGGLTIPVLALLGAVVGGASAFLMPASMALVPQTVAPDDLRSANAGMRTTMNGASIAGAALGGVLVGTSVGAALAVDAATFAVGAVCCAAIGVLGPVAATGTSSVLAELRDGWREFRATRWLWVVVAQFGVVNAAWNGAFSVLGPVQADRHLGGASAWGLVVAGTSAGLLLGALISFRLRPRRPLVVGQLGVLAGVSLVLALIGPLPTAALVAAAMLGGVGNEIFGVQWSVAVHQHVPEASMARLSSYDMLGSFVMIPVGVAVAGPVAAAAGMTATLIGAAALIVLPTLATLLVRDVRDLPATDRAASC